MTSIAHQVLYGKEEELVHLLSLNDPVEIANNLFKKCVISDTMWDLFTSLDHGSVEPQLEIRYLLRLVRKRLEDGGTVWDKFLNCLAGMGSTCNTVRKELQDQLERITGSIEVTSAASGEADAILTTEDAEDLTELLAEIAYKWEELAMALKLPRSMREKCRCRDKDIISLNNVLVSWLKGNSNTRTATNLHSLVNALCGGIVSEYRVGKEFEKHYRPVTRARLSLLSENINNSNLTITYQSGNTQVADGKSTILLVQASPGESVSYQWKKDGQPLVNSSTYTGLNDEILVIGHARQGIEGEYTCHVSNEGREICSNKITLTVEFPRAKKLLLDLYSATSEVPSDSWPPSGTRTFINLALIESSKEPTDVTDYFICGNPDEVIAEKKRVEYEHVFYDYSSGALILLEGRPGSGKTTLVHKIIQDWTKGKALVNARCVVLITLRDLNNRKVETLYDILTYFCQNNEGVTKDIERENGEGLCLIIDGLDEYQPQDRNYSPIYQLLYKTILPKAMVIVSSRPAATKDLKWEKLTIKIEVFGFTREQIYEYIDYFPFGSVSSDSDVSKMYPAKLKEYLHSNPIILNMCYLPVHAAMICFLFKSRSEQIPITQTKIYEEFTCSTILRHLTRYNREARLESLQGLTGDTKKHFDDLCFLAFRMTINSKQIVIPQEISVQLSKGSLPEDMKYLGLVTISATAKVSGFHSSYTFLHLTFQEFLAAVYISSLDTAEQMRVIEEYSNSAMSTVWTFYCGLVDFRNGVERLHKLLCAGLYDKEFMHFAFESQQPAVCDEVVKHTRGEFCSDMFGETLSDLSAIGYVLSATSQPIYKLDLYGLGGKIMDASLQLLQFHKKKLHQLEKLKIDMCNSALVSVLASFLNTCINLKEALLYFLQVDPIGMKCLAGGLNSLSNLQELYLQCLGSTSGGITQLFSGLQHLPNTKLDLSFYELGISDVVELGRGIQQLTANRMHRLVLSSSSIGAEGASALSSGLPKLTKLVILTLSANNIGDDEASDLSIGIRSLSSLSALDLPRNKLGACGITSLANAIKSKNITRLRLYNNNTEREGASALAAAIRHHKELKHLDVSSNNIGSDGATALAAAIQHHKELKELDLSSNNIGSDGATALAAAIQHHKELKYLYLSSNNIGSEGATTLAAAIQHHKELEELYLSSNNIGSEGMTALAAAIQHHKELKYLDLSSNNIGSEGATALAAAIQQHKELKYLNVSRNNIGSEGATALAATIQHHKEFQIWGLSSNNIGSEGLTALAAAIKHHKEHLD